MHCFLQASWWALVSTDMRGLHACRYGCSKWASEVQLQQLHERHGVPVSIFRCGMILAHSKCAFAGRFLSHAVVACMVVSSSCGVCMTMRVWCCQVVLSRRTPLLQVPGPDQPDRLLHAPAGRRRVHAAGAGVLLQGPHRPRPPLRRHVRSCLCCALQCRGVRAGRRSFVLCFNGSTCDAAWLHMRSSGVGCCMQAR